MDMGAVAPGIWGAVDAPTIVPMLPVSPKLTKGLLLLPPPGSSPLPSPNGLRKGSLKEGLSMDTLRTAAPDPRRGTLVLWALRGRSIEPPRGDMDGSCPSTIGGRVPDGIPRTVSTPSPGNAIPPLLLGPLPP